ncbi:MAG: ethylbenzene dehydrogenase-related protein [SAR202 cluster bacterium]|nr:ethylbenzene dehydrogenase-related protein [SAR202 cluster bacterium]|tara:strand:+ start:1886 stop:2917 length:1032 start_codon:yes stop_codon:yes gene_type:complete
MTKSTTGIGRRAVMVAASAAAIGWVLRPFGKAAAAQKATLIGKEVDSVPTDPGDALWDKSDILEVPLSPQAVVKPRTYEAGVTDIKARALYDKDRLAFLLEWGDAGREVTIGGVETFRDAVAVEFPSEPGDAIPYFGMGEQNSSVTIYHWKSDWQYSADWDADDEYPNIAVDWYPFSGREAGEIAQASDYDSPQGDKAFNTSRWAGSNLANAELQSRTPIEKLNAEGFGTVRPVVSDRQDGLGNGVWNNGIWKTVISIPRTQEEFTFERGATVPVAFAGWDGAKKERGGEKAISTWYFLSLEQSAGAFAYINPVIAILGAIAVQFVGLRMLRRKAKAADQDNE